MSSAYCDTCREWWPEVEVVDCLCGQRTCGNCVILDEDVDAAEAEEGGTGFFWKCPRCKKVRQ